VLPLAYELCIHKITPEQLQTLDLSSWDVAFNGAEPIRQDTLERFCALHVAGLKPATIKTNYYPIVAADADEDVRTLVSCGQSLPEQQIAIVHPETLTRC